MDWTPEAIAAEGAKRDAQAKRGICPDSGETIKRCQATDLCDCFRFPRGVWEVPEADLQ